MNFKLPSGADPLFGWTEEKTQAYIVDRPLKAGDQMLIVNQQAGLEEYVLATVLNADSGKQHRIVLDQAAAYGGASFYRTGKNCFAPRGKSRMIPPVEEVLAEIAKSPNKRWVMSNRHYGQGPT